MPTLSNEATFKIAKEALASYNENQLIYDEFNYYQEKKEVLGVHPVFRVYKLKRSIAKMREVTASKRLSNLINYINRDSRKMETIKDSEKRIAFSEKIDLWKEERDLIKSIHNFE